MKFVHVSDCHLGGWREDKLRYLGLLSFQKMVDYCLKEKIDFLLIAGDLFDTALPSIDVMKFATEQLKRLHTGSIPVYIIAGSHDYSPSGKTMLDVLEKAGLVYNVVKFIEENDTKIQLSFTSIGSNVKIAGLYGKRGGLEKAYYALLDKSQLEKEDGFKIFMFHTALTEFKPEGLEAMDSLDLAYLPKGFQYYAGGHVHYIFSQKREEYGHIAFPGALFPNNFKELEQFECGGFYSVEVNGNEIIPTHIKLPLKLVQQFHCNVDQKSATDARGEIVKCLQERDITDTIVTLRVFGRLTNGTISDIQFPEIMKQLDKAYAVLKNTARIDTSITTKVEVMRGNVEEIEEILLKETVQKYHLTQQQELVIKELLGLLDAEKREGERTDDFEERIVSHVFKLLEVNDAPQKT